MSINTRIKERRENLHMTRAELAEKIGVTPSAIANYENAVSSPKIELMYKLFEELNCDANYLYQDDMEIMTKFNCSLQEQDHIKKYRDLDGHGKEMVDFTLLKEWERSKTPAIVSLHPVPVLNAARPRTDLAPEDITEEMIQHDEDIMNDPNF